LSNIAVVILNWNGEKILGKFLPSVVKYSKKIADIIIIDNASTDNSVAFLKNNYPTIKIIQLEKNHGFAGGYNLGLQEVKHDYYILLNSDVEVTENWIDPVIEVFSLDESIIACQPKIRAYNNKEYFEYAGAAGGYMDKYGYPFCKGRIFNTLEKDENQYNDIEEIFWASGACLFIKSEAYHNAGGFDEFFFAHMEEIDLCWRLKNQGYKIMYCPNSTVFHLGGGTLSKINPKKTFLNFRNSLLAIHKNLPKNIRFKTIFIRLIFDGIAVARFLVSGQPKHAFSVLRAHFSFYSSIQQNKLKRNLSNNPNKKGIINKSIVVEYFIKKRTLYKTIIK